MIRYFFVSLRFYKLNFTVFFPFLCMYINIHQIDKVLGNNYNLNNDLTMSMEGGGKDNITKGLKGVFA